MLVAYYLSLLEVDNRFYGLKLIQFCGCSLSKNNMKLSTELTQSDHKYLQITN